MKTEKTEVACHLIKIFSDSVLQLQGTINYKHFTLGAPFFLYLGKAILPSWEASLSLNLPHGM